MPVMVDREQLVAELREGLVEVHFTKVDGSSRVMRATLAPRLMPQSMKAEDLNAAHEHRKTNPGVIAVWDTQAGGWRSFRVDSVTYVQGVQTE